MSIKGKHLTKEDWLDVSAYEKSNSSASAADSKLDEVSIHVKCLNEKQKRLKKAIENKEIIISTGPAGTGRTYMSLLTGLSLVKKNPRYRRLVLIKSLQTIQGEAVGILPGTLREKMEPYMYSFTGNLDKILGSKKLTKGLIEDEVVEILPIAYIRGVTIDNAIVIIDEAQNIDMHTFKTIITRIGRNSKMIFLGDTGQVDRRNVDESCLMTAGNLFRGSDFAELIEFTAEESVRNPIIPKMLEVLDYHV